MEWRREDAGKGVCVPHSDLEEDESGGSPREDLEIREPLLCKAEAPSEL